MEKRNRRLGEGFRYLRTKVVLGYLLISLLAAVPMFFIMNNLQSLSLLDTSGQVTKDKMFALNETFYNLYAAECLIGEALVSPSKFEEYSSLTDSLNGQIARMKDRFNEQGQAELLDTLSLLLNQKRRNVQSLVWISANSSIDELYRKQLTKTIEESDSLFCNRVVEKTVKVVSDTLTYQLPAKKKRSFFRRLFSSSEEPDDTVVEIRKLEYSVTDSLLSSYNPADTINQILENLKKQVSETKISMDRAMVNKMVEIQEMNKDINLRMNEIIHQLQEEDWENTVSVFDGREATFEKMRRSLRYFVVGALLLLLGLVVMVWRDINKSRRYNRALEVANRKTLKLMDSREKLMLSVAHDIKAPLGSIIGYIELLGNNKLSPKLNYYIDNMKSSSEHILHLVTDILDFNRLDAGVVDLNPLPFNCRSLFEDVVAAFRPQAEKKNLSLDFRFSSDTNSVTLVGDPLRIRQIAHNLVSNAVKFTNKGGVSLSVSLRRADGRTCLLGIEVADTGVGISKENQKLIFNEYVRVPGGGQTSVEGFGLGLSILRKLVGIYNGSLSLESEPGKGSTFRVSLPLAYSTDVAPVENAPKPCRDPRLLVVDDDPSQLTMVSEQLKSRGLSCTVCDNPYFALDLIEKNAFDIVLTDIQMPGFNGFELVKRIRNGTFPNARELPVIALSARADISVSEFKMYGFTSFLNKPFSCDQLMGEISKFVDLQDVAKRITSDSSEYAPKTAFGSILSYAGGDLNAEYEILSSFLAETKKNVVELERLRSEGDLQQASRLAHKMLSIFKLIGDSSLVGWLSDLECGREGVFSDSSSFACNLEKIGRLLVQGEDHLRCLSKKLDR